MFEKARIPAVAVPLEEKQPEEDIPTSALVDDEKKVRTRHAEATWVELSCDLFFVANLTTFTDSHQINDRYTFPPEVGRRNRGFGFTNGVFFSMIALQSYIGYFAILCFTWLRAALFDLRFGRDILIQRIGVTVGFYRLQIRSKISRTKLASVQTLSLLLFASGFAIAIQYSVVWWNTQRPRCHRS